MPLAQNALVIANKQLSKDFYELEFLAPDIAKECQPGQFVQVQLSANYDPLLRRPLSIYDVDSSVGSVSLLYKLVGKGTEILSTFKAKNYINVMGPLGKGFTISLDSRSCLLLGGGVGIAPLIYLARRLKAEQKKVLILHGAAEAKQIVVKEKMHSMELDYYFATDDGSLGFKGSLIDLMEKRLDASKFDYIYTCGPEIMMKKVSEYAAKKGIKGEVSLEEHMACGVGACLGCAKKAKPKDQAYLKVCKDGPVFKMSDIEL